MSTVSAMRPGRFPAVALVIALLVAAANLAAWSWMNRPTQLPEWSDSIRGFAYSGFRRDEDPKAGRFPTQEELAADMAMLTKIADRIRTYTATENSQVPALAGEQALRVTAGAWLDKRDDNNEREITALVQLVRDNKNIDRVMVGNEAILRGDLSVPEMIDYLDRVRRHVKVPVSTAEPWHVWLRNPELAKHVDFITVHLLPFWEGVPVEEAVDYALQRYDEVQAAFPKKKVVIGEIGWPSRGDRMGGAYATPEAQAQFMREFFDRTLDRKLDYYVMEAFDQPWKSSFEGRTGAYWGMFNVDRTPKFPLAGPVIGDPGWRAKALASLVLAVPFMIWFGWRFRRFKPAGILFFAALIQAAAALTVWLVMVPFNYYLSWIDWAAMLVLTPALVAMMAVLLANGFEFTEVMWRRRWLRGFGARGVAPGTKQPFVSIHLPCYNEPPEMVILTIDSLARLDYDNFEVLVIDNNTRDEAVWKPVEAHVATLGPKFRFFHLPQWPGFKAGALNFALTQTDPRAEIIGVVDADYAASPEWLKSLVGHFAEEKVAVVQAPQAHRDFERNAFQRMANWEFDGFFRIGMHHRNERNAIIQHGTMTLVRREALEKTGSWSEWCICEDAELGLRLMHAGYETRYVDHVLGQGLTPADFKSFKSQRFRWAFGAMQILKGRWNWLVKPGPLTAGQRYHFLTGWFSWFADALHLVFTMGALAWTIGMLGFPRYFSLPLDLFLVPVLVFFVAKAFFGPVLYRRRVPCSWADVVGASVASMALSHAIARGVFQGLFQKKAVFVRTDKKRNPKSRWSAAFLPVREEGLLALALALGAAGMIFRFGSHHREAVLWATILGAQALPYLSALLTTWISERAANAARAGADARPATPRPASNVVPFPRPGTPVPAGAFGTTPVAA